MLKMSMLLVSTLAEAELEAELPPDPDEALLDACAFALALPFPLPKAVDLADELLLAEPPLANEFEFALETAFEPEEGRCNHLIRTKPDSIALTIDDAVASALADTPMKATVNDQLNSEACKQRK